MTYQELVEQTWDDPEAEARAAEKGVLKKIDSTVIIQERTQQELEDEVRSEVDANVGQEEEFEQFARERPKSADSFRDPIAPDPLDSLTPEEQPEEVVEEERKSLRR